MAKNDLFDENAPTYVDRAGDATEKAVMTISITKKTRSPAVT
jgi:hypothetical protein